MFGTCTHDLLYSSSLRTPLFSTPFVCLSRSSLFIKLGLYYAYNLGWIHSNDEWKVVFLSWYRHFGYNCPFWSHKCTKNLISTHGQWYFFGIQTFSYLDDISIFAKTQVEYDVHVPQVLQQLNIIATYLYGSKTGANFSILTKTTIDLLCPIYDVCKFIKNYLKMVFLLT